MIDLQIHTTDSDGTWSWTQVLDYCAGMGLSAFAITDHDTIVRRNEIRAWATLHNKMAISGIELSTKENDQTVHLLGYFLEGPLEELENELTILRDGRDDRNKKIISKLRDLKFDVSDEDLKRVAGKATVGRPHIARLLMEKGYVGSIKEAFDRFLSPGMPGYFPKEEMPLRKGIEVLRNAGAVTSVAHPMLLRRGADLMERSIAQWKDWGLDALEAIYPTYTVAETVFMDRMTSKYRLLKTGGSDFHGDNKPQIKIGVGLGSLSVGDEILAPLLSRRDELLNEYGSKRTGSSK